MRSPPTARVPTRLLPCGRVVSVSSVAGASYQGISRRTAMSGRISTRRASQFVPIVSLHSRLRWGAVTAGSCRVRPGLGVRHLGEGRCAVGTRLLGPSPRGQWQPVRGLLSAKINSHGAGSPSSPFGWFLWGKHMLVVVHCTACSVKIDRKHPETSTVLCYELVTSSSHICLFPLRVITGCTLPARRTPITSSGVLKSVAPDWQHHHHPPHL